MAETQKIKTPFNRFYFNLSNKESDMEDSEVSNDNIARIMEPVTNYTTT